MPMDLVPIIAIEKLKMFLASMKSKTETPYWSFKILNTTKVLIEQTTWMFIAIMASGLLSEFVACATYSL